MTSTLVLGSKDKTSRVLYPMFCAVQMARHMIRNFAGACLKIAIEFPLRGERRQKFARVRGLCGDRFGFVRTEQAGDTRRGSSASRSGSSRQWFVRRRRDERAV